MKVPLISPIKGPVAQGVSSVLVKSGYLGVPRIRATLRSHRS